MTALIPHPSKPGYVGVHQAKVSKYFMENPEERAPREYNSPCQQCPDRGDTCPTCAFTDGTFGQKPPDGKGPTDRLTWVTQETAIRIALEVGL